MQVDVTVNVADYGPITALAVIKMNRKIRERGQNQLQGQGLGRRFGCRTKTEKKGKAYKSNVYIKPGFGKVFEFGSTSVGRTKAGGLLWIGVTAGSKHVRAKTFRKHGNKMFRPPGTNVLIGRKDGQIKYVGIPSVTVTPSVHIRKVADEEAHKFGLYMVQARTGGL